MLKTVAAVHDEIITKVYNVKLELEKEQEDCDNDKSSSANGPTPNPDETDLSFLFLESELERKCLTKLNQLPLKGVETIVDFVNSLPATQKLFQVMQNMQMTECLKFPISEASAAMVKVAVFQPKLYCQFLTGTGYYCPLDQLTHRVAALDLGYERYPTMIGFALPERIACQRIGQIFNICKIFRNSVEIRHARHEELRLTQGIIGASGPSCPSNKYQCEPKPGYNVSHKKQYADIAFTFVREYRQFSLSLLQASTMEEETPSSQGTATDQSTWKPNLSLDFLNRIQEVCTYEIEDYFGEKQWHAFFTFYGTHVVVSSSGGGKLILTISETQLKHYFKTNNLISKQTEIEQLFSSYLDLDDYELRDSKENPFETLCINSIKLFGGDSTYEGIDVVKSTKNPSELRNVLHNWVKSLQYKPTMLDSTIVLESIPDILDRFGLISEAFIVDNAAKQLFGKSLRSGTVTTKKQQVDMDVINRRRSSTLTLPSSYMKSYEL